MANVVVSPTALPSAGVATGLTLGKRRREDVHWHCEQHITYDDAHEIIVIDDTPSPAPPTCPPPSWLAMPHNPPVTLAGHCSTTTAGMVAASVSLVHRTPPMPHTIAGTIADNVSAAVPQAYQTGQLPLTPQEPWKQWSGVWTRGARARWEQQQQQQQHPLPMSHTQQQNQHQLYQLYQQQSTANVVQPPVWLHDDQQSHMQQQQQQLQLHWQQQLLATQADMHAAAAIAVATSTATLANSSVDSTEEAISRKRRRRNPPAPLNVLPRTPLTSSRSGIESLIHTPTTALATPQFLTGHSVLVASTDSSRNASLSACMERMPTATSAVHGSHSAQLTRALQQHQRQQHGSTSRALHGNSMLSGGISTAAHMTARAHADSGSLPTTPQLQQSNKLSLTPCQCDGCALPITPVRSDSLYTLAAAAAAAAATTTAGSRIIPASAAIMSTAAAAVAAASMVVPTLGYTAPAPITVPTVTAQPTYALLSNSSSSASSSSAATATTMAAVSAAAAAAAVINNLVAHPSPAGPLSAINSIAAAAVMAANKPIVSPIAQTSQQALPPCDDKEGHYIVTPGENLTPRYKILRLLGQGTFGKVAHCWDRQTARHCAVKIIRAVQKYRDASRIELRVLRELQRWDPKNQYRCIHLRECFDYRNHICMVFDLYAQSVFDFMKSNHFAPFPAEHIQQLARQLLTSVAFLHRISLVHTDLKPENILLVDATADTYKSRSGKDRRILRDTEIRLIDFGSATFEKEYHSAVVSTRHYRAPEIILGCGWSYPCDIWSVGCILVELFTGEALFQTHDNLEHLAMMEAALGTIPSTLIQRANRAGREFFRGSRLAYPISTTSRASRRSVETMRRLEDVVAPKYQFNIYLLDLVRRMLVYNPEERISAADALRHPFFQLPLSKPVVNVANVSVTASSAAAAAAAAVHPLCSPLSHSTTSTATIAAHTAR